MDEIITEIESKLRLAADMARSIPEGIPTVSDVERQRRWIQKLEQTAENPITGPVNGLTRSEGKQTLAIVLDELREMETAAKANRRLSDGEDDSSPPASLGPRAFPRADDDSAEADDPGEPVPRAAAIYSTGDGWLGR